MLPPAHRLRQAADYRAVLRGRRDATRLLSARSGGRLLVVHIARREARPDDRPASDIADASGTTVPRVGFVVSKAVGNAVVRNRTKRVLRHLVAQRLGELPADADVVIRALPASAAADTAALSRDLDRGLRRSIASLS